MDNEMHNAARGISIKNVLAGLFVGALMGTGFALLKAPQSGVETRRQIRGKAIELQTKTADAVANATSKVEQVTDRIAERATELRGGGIAELSEASYQHSHSPMEETR